MSRIENLFKLMEERNITVKQLSEEAHISQGNISDWKSGRSMPKAESLIKLSQYFQVSIDYLLNNDPHSQN